MKADFNEDRLPSTLRADGKHYRKCKRMRRLAPYDASDTISSAVILETNMQEGDAGGAQMRECTSEAVSAQSKSKEIDRREAKGGMTK